MELIITRVILKGVIKTKQINSRTHGNITDE